MKKIGIYVHIPFCIRKCNYCDFYSVKWNEELEHDYINSVIKEIKNYKETINANYLVDTIYFGGGTPTVISPSNINKIIAAIGESFDICNSSEISMEANPNTLTSNNLVSYKGAGINRLSIGVQSLNDEILKRLGRLHSSKEALESIETARMHGFENINADVMFNIPGQTISDVEDTILKLANANVNHISFYSLKLEKGTPMYVMEKNHEILMPEEDIEREMYYAGRNIMENKNLMQYEISNFSLKGYECKHNLKYWMQEEYIGIGPSAHSFLNNERYSNPSDINSYINNACNDVFNRNIQEVLDQDALIFEYIMLNLRLTEGMSIIYFSKKFSLNFNKKYEHEIKYLIENKLLEYDGSSIKLTKRGMDISNYVFQRFM